MKYLFIIGFLLTASESHAQQIVLICTQTPSGTVSCTPVSPTNPLPVVLQ